MSAWPRENVGSASQPVILRPSPARSKYRACSMNRSPQTLARRASCCSRVRAGASDRVIRPLFRSRHSTSNLASAMLRNIESTCEDSVRSVFRNLRRAGVLKNRSRTSTVVPGGCAAGRSAAALPPSHSTLHAESAPSARETSRNFATEAMLGKASPRKPRLATFSSSCSVEILLVAWRDSASASWSLGMPMPSSRTRISLVPPDRISSSMRDAPASRLFSTSSLTADAGRSTISPAAIWSMRSEGRMRIDMAIF